MNVLDLFSKRQKRAQGQVPDVYSYTELPHPLRVQILHIIDDAVGVNRAQQEFVDEVYIYIKDALCREYGLFELIQRPKSAQDSVFNFFLQETSIPRALDVVELSFKVICTYVEGDDYKFFTTRKMTPEDAVAELNIRFREHGVGYQFESGELIRMDSELIHAEVVKPTLALLRDKKFSGANEEFLKAHEHYRHGRHKECLVDALKAFESTMQTICQLRGWPVAPRDSAKNLIKICMDNGLVPAYMDSQFQSLRALFESGIPTVRNKHGGHGQGATPVEVPEYLSRYALNLTGTTILFFIEVHRATK